MCESWQQDDDKLTFIVVDMAAYREDKDDVRHMVGDVNCFFNDPDDPLDNVEVEMMIAEPTARRKGFATEALQLIMAYCARDLRVKGFRAQILRKNEGSRRLFEGLGFSFDKAIDVFDEEVWKMKVGDLPPLAALRCTPYIGDTEVVEATTKT